MKNTARKLVTGGVMASLFSLLGQLQAATYTVPDDTNDWSHSVSIDQFSLSAGTLTSITVAVTENIQLQGSVNNRSGLPTTFGLTENANLTLSLGADTLTTSFPTINQSFSLASHESQAVSAGYSFNQTFTLTGPAMIPFVGDSTATMVVDALAAQNNSGPGSVLVDLLTISDAKIDITYNYNPIPEPSVCGLMLVGAGVVALRRRIRR